VISVVGDIIDETIKKTIKEFAAQLRAEHGKK
jgi:predicted Zn-dependent peptidase